MWNAGKRLTLSVAHMQILKLLLLFVFQYSQGIFGMAIIKKRNTYRRVVTGIQIQLLGIRSLIVAISSLF